MPNKSPNTKAAPSSSGAVTKSTAGRKCSVCAHPQAEQINSCINIPKSFRAISCQFWGDESARESIRRHSENCLNLEIQALIRQKKITTAINHYAEVSEQLEFAKELRIAARAYLRDPQTGELTLIPRSTEIEVIYDDYADAKPNGEPKRKRDALSRLLERARTGSVEPAQTVIKHVDIRSFALDSIRATDTVLDKIAKVEGLYKQTFEPPAPKNAADVELAIGFFKLLRTLNYDFETAQAGTLHEYPYIDVELLTDGSY